MRSVEFKVLVARAERGYVEASAVSYRLTIPASVYRVMCPSGFGRPGSITGNVVPELSFHFNEVHLITGSDLVRFMRDRYRYKDQPELTYRWPLFFASGRWGTDYAWTVFGHTEQRRHEHNKPRQTLSTLLQ